VIYLDTSVALAQLLSEDRRPPATIWSEDLVSSRLLEYEMFTRINALGLTRSHAEPARRLLGLVSILEMVPPVLERALEPFPVPVRTLDAIHLASMVFLHDQRQEIQIASYDDRLIQAAESLGFSQWPDLST
jgi:hypothetical protein